MYKLLEDDVARFLATSDRMEGLKISFWGLISADSRNKQTKLSRQQRIAGVLGEKP